MEFYFLFCTFSTYFFRFLSCWCLCVFFAIVDTTFSMWIILKDFHCSAWFLRHVLFPMNGMTTNLRNLNHDDVDAESRRSYAASLIFADFYRTLTSTALQPLIFIYTYTNGQNLFPSTCLMYVSWFTGCSFDCSDCVCVILLNLNNKQQTTKKKMRGKNSLTLVCVAEIHEVIFCHTNVAFVLVQWDDNFNSKV